MAAVSSVLVDVDNEFYRASRIGLQGQFLLAEVVVSKEVLAATAAAQTVNQNERRNGQARPDEIPAVNVSVLADRLAQMKLQYDHLELQYDHIERQQAQMLSLLQSLVEKQTVKEWYSTEEVAKIIKRSEYRVRECCRQGRIKAEKKGSGRGRYQSWVISHAELQRIQKDGLLPVLRS